MVLLVCFVWVACHEKSRALARRGGFAFFACKMTARRRQANARRESRRRTRLGSESRTYLWNKQSRVVLLQNHSALFFEFTMPFCIFSLARGTFRRICRPVP